MPDDLTERERLFRLECLHAFLLAFERREEVLRVVYDAEDAELARARLCDLLQVSDVAADSVLNLQWRRLTRLDRARIEEERNRLARHLPGEA